MHFQNLRVSARPANLVGAAFYSTVAVIALAGQTIAATEWLGWDVFYAAGAAAALELGGIALAAHADLRRRVGERALAARLLSAAVALFAIGFNWVGHADHRQAAFFAGMSALGYSVWLIQSGARRRDQMRSDGTLAPTAPVYGWLRWVRHPLATWKARELFMHTPTLGLYGSLKAASDAARAEAEQARIVTREKLTAAVLKAKLEAAAVSELDAQLAVAVLDLDEVAQRMRRQVDYKALTAVVMADLVPARLFGAQQASVSPATVAEVNAAMPDRIADLYLADGSLAVTSAAHASLRHSAEVPTSPAPAGIGHLLAPQPPRPVRQPATRVTARTTVLPPVPSLLNPGLALVQARVLEISDRESD